MNRGGGGVVKQRGWVVVEHFSTAIIDPMSKVLSFSESLESQMMCFNLKFHRGHNLSFFGLGPWAIIHGIAKLANTFISQI